LVRNKITRSTIGCNTPVSGPCFISQSRVSCLCAMSDALAAAVVAGWFPEPGPIKQESLLILPRQTRRTQHIVWYYGMN
jgi:hypothetical protein